MKVTAVSIKPITTAKVLKAAGKCEIDGELSLAFTVLDAGKGPFISWKGTEQYKKADNTTGYSSPIFFKNKETNEYVQKEVINKYTLECGGAAGNAGGNGLSDDVPF